MEMAKKGEFVKILAGPFHEHLLVMRLHLLMYCIQCNKFGRICSEDSQRSVE